MPDIDPTIPPAKWLKDWHVILKKRCSQRILIVANNASPFDPGANTGLTELVRVLQGSGEVPMPMPITVTQASTAAGFSFASAAPAVTVANYDQVWLFGFDAGGTPGPTGADLHVLVTFMQAGGGLFATGDHSSIGRGLCGNLPRVRAMREWSAVPMGGPNRLDTVNHPGDDGVAFSEDQADRHPQTIYPLLVGVGASAVPHALLASPSGAINVLPDHPHESECYAPRGAALAQTYPAIALQGLPPIAAFEEFPPVAGVRIGPELAAISMSASLNQSPGKGPVAPRCFGAISAYDGHPANRGRVVCDATWHHFVNMNLNGAGYPGDGLREGTPLAPNAAYKQIQRYYGNIADYLVPKTRRWCSLFDPIFTEIFRYPLWEELQTLPPIPRPPEPPWPLLVEVGQLTAQAVDARRGRGNAVRMVDALIDVADLPAEWAESLNSSLMRADRGAQKRESARVANSADVAELRHGMLGSIVLALREALPEDPHAAVKKADAMHDAGFKTFRGALLRDLATGVEQMRKRHNEDLRALARLGKAD